MTARKLRIMPKPAPVLDREPDPEPGRDLISARWLAYQGTVSDAWRTHQATLTAARTTYDQQAADAWQTYIEAVAKGWEAYVHAADNAVVPGTAEPTP